MSRVWADRIVRTLAALFAAGVLWIIAYEIAVGIRFKKNDPTEGAARWALVRAQFADLDFSTFGWNTVLLAPRHFWRRVEYPATQEEALRRGGGAFLFVAAVGVALAIVLKANGPAKHKGDAQFGSLLDAARRRLTGRRGLILGKMSGTVIRNADPAHILMIAPSRSGKGSGFIVPNGYDHDGSFVFWDTKRENFDILSRYLRDKGVKVFLFRPGGTQSHRYNPLDFVRRDENMPTDCAVVASFLVPERADDTWSGAARMLLATLIGYVLASRNCEGSRHLRGVARMTVTGKDISVVLKSLARSEGHLLPRWIVDGFNQYVALEPETRNSAVFNVNMAMNPWNNPLISSATETSDFDLREFRRERMAVFVACSIPELVQFRPIIRIFFQQVHDLLMDKRPGPDEPYEVLIALDEFYHLGPMHSLLTKITISAGYKFRMAIMIQNMAQLDELYGKPLRQSTLAGAQVKLFLAIDDLETANYLSEMLGDTTVKVTTPIRRAGGGIFAPAGENIHYEGKALRSARELREMPEREAILIVRSACPFLLRVFRHYEDSPFKEIYARYGEIPITVPALRRWGDRDMGVILQGSESSNAPPRPIQEREAPSQVGETSPQAAIEVQQIAPARVEEKKPFATPVLTSVEMMQIDDGKNFKAFLESEKLKTNDAATRAKFDKLIAEIDEVGATIVGLPAPIPAE
jgi:type IV secretion system protein VirD4